MVGGGAFLEEADGKHVTMENLVEWDPQLKQWLF